MKRLFFYLFMISALGLLFVACKENDMDDLCEEVVEDIKEKYEELNSKAEYVTANGVPVTQKTRFIKPEDGVVPEGMRLRQIALVRHGEPNLKKSGRFNYDEAKEFIKHYDSVGIVVPDEPFFMIDDAEEVALFTSTIPRAQATTKYLFGGDRNVTVSADFREFERAIGNRRIKMDLPLKYWTTSARILWMLGFDREGIESFSEARQRSRRAAKLLADASEENSKVILVAHGFLNRFIKRNLEKEGWHVVRDGGDNYFATTILVKIEPELAGENAPLAQGKNAPLVVERD